MELNPNDSGAMSNLSVLETDLGHYSEALHWARRAFRLAPNSGNAYYHVGVPLLPLGDDATTERWLTEGEQHFPSTTRASRSCLPCWTCCAEETGTHWSGPEKRVRPSPATKKY